MLMRAGVVAASVSDRLTVSAGVTGFWQVEDGT